MARRQVGKRACIEEKSISDDQHGILVESIRVTDVVASTPESTVSVLHAPQGTQ